MKLNFSPKTYLGKLSLILIAGFLFAFLIFLLFVSLGERGGEKFFSNLKLALPGLFSALFATTSFFVGLISIVKQKENSVLVFVSIGIGFLVLLWCLAEIIFPHQISG